MKDEGVNFDVQSYNTFLSSASARGRLDIIELLVEHMHRENIQPDDAAVLPDRFLFIPSNSKELCPSEKSSVPILFKERVVSKSFLVPANWAR